VFRVADRIAVLYLGQLVAQGPATEFDPQSVVEIMTTGTSSRRGNGNHATASRGSTGLED
jgi:ABC-type sugar transport system ATPase subunit